MNIWQEQAVVDPFPPLRVLLNSARIDLTWRPDHAVRTFSILPHLPQQWLPDEVQDPSPPAVYSSSSSSSWSITREANRVLRALGDYEKQQHNYRKQVAARTTSAINKLLAKCRFHRMRFAWFRGQDVSDQTCMLASVAGRLKAGAPVSGFPRCSFDL